MLACENCNFYTFLEAVSGAMKFCPTDGTPLVSKEPPRCECGHSYPPGHGGTFCTDCGKQLPAELEEN